MKTSTFELYTQAAHDEVPLEAESLPWRPWRNAHDDPGRLSRPALAIDETTGPVWGVADHQTGTIDVVGQKDAEFGLQIVTTPSTTPRRSYVALLPRRDDMLVNGIPALAITLLSARDSVVLAGGCLAYVTERRQAFRGKPDAELVGQACQYCRIALTSDTHVVVCPWCQSPYHDEDQTTHPEAAERLDCFRQVKNCLGIACSHELSLEPQLVWDPRQF